MCYHVLLLHRGAELRAQARLTPARVSGEPKVKLEKDLPEVTLRRLDDSASFHTSTLRLEARYQTESSNGAIGSHQAR